MYYFTPETIVQANKNIEELDSKVGGLLCVLHCLSESIEENLSYIIDGEALRRQLSMVFDKEPKDSFENAKPSYIIFAKDWFSTFFKNVIKNKVDLLSCAVFFLRRHGFEKEYTAEEVIDLFIDVYNLKKIKDSWFYTGNRLQLVYNQCDVEDNQVKFYSKMNYVTPFKSILFHNVIQKSAADLKAAGQIQTLYSGSSIHTCFLLSDEPLDQYYVMAISNHNTNNSSATKSEPNIKSCLEITREPRTNKVHPINFIVYGAPGTGKTYSMVEYALAIVDNMTLEAFRAANTNRKDNVARYKSLVKSGQIVFTTFHQNYGYEEFIQGLRPDKDSETMAFKTVDGVFKVIADTALNDTEGKNFVIIIDEINRANISKVFGELITLIEEDKRWGELNETSATLQSGDPFAVPNNLYIVGTMNSADKSISLIDAALRRRFDFIEQKPDAALVDDSVLQAILININTRLVKDLDSTDLLVGHSYFMNKSEKDLSCILNNNIIPLLYEYYYDDRKKVRNLLETVIKETNAKVEIVDEEVGRLRVKDV